MSVTLREQRFPTGMTVFGPLPETTDAYLMWAGRGAGLWFTIRPFDTDGVIRSIEHPSADGTYDTLKDARKAARAFVEAES